MSDASFENPDSPARRAMSDDGEDALANELLADEVVPKPKRRRGLITLLVILALVIASVAAVGVWYMRSLGQIDREESLLPNTAERSNSPTPTAGQVAPVNFLIIGSDSRGTDGGRSDVLMMAHIPASRDAVYLISFPRDMWVDVPGYGESKINAAYAYGGASLAVQTVEELTGSYIDHVAVTDFESFVSAIDAIGGVTVNNKVASSSQGYSFPEGEITLDGESALAYVRERKDLPNGDLDRAERQRAVVIAVVKKLMTPEVIANPVKFNQAASEIAPHVTVDADLTNAVMIKLATSMKIASGLELRSLQAPILGFGTSADGQSIDLVDETTLEELKKALSDGSIDAYWQAHKDDSVEPS